ncbi:hypothetical protein J6590_020656 [Homalodisca vitripennis]|nr:hypothetical protein J6590_020656 [Homalodisca vitripennis]
MQCGSSQDSEGPDSPLAPSLKTKDVEMKNEIEEETEESEDDDMQVKHNMDLKEDSSADLKSFDGKEANVKEENKVEEMETFKDDKEFGVAPEPDSNEEKQLANAAASAIKRKSATAVTNARRPLRLARPFCKVDIHAITWIPAQCGRPGTARTGLLYSVKMHTIKWTPAQCERPGSGRIGPNGTRRADRGWAGPVAVGNASRSEPGPAFL